MVRWYHVKKWRLPPWRHAVACLMLGRGLLATISYFMRTTVAFVPPSLFWTESFNLTWTHWHWLRGCEVVSIVQGVIGKTWNFQWICQFSSAILGHRQIPSYCQKKSIMAEFLANRRGLAALWANQSWQMMNSTKWRNMTISSRNGTPGKFRENAGNSQPGYLNQINYYLQWLWRSYICWYARMKRTFQLTLYAIHK